VSLKTAVLPRNDNSGFRSLSTAANNRTLPASKAPVTRAEISGVSADELFDIGCYSGCIVGAGVAQPGSIRAARGPL
jgi:hypothetical protein